MLTTYTLWEREGANYSIDRSFLSKWPWSHVVMDEAHALKNSSSTRSKKLRKVAGLAATRIMLTGESGGGAPHCVCVCLLRVGSRAVGWLSVHPGKVRQLPSLSPAYRVPGTPPHHASFFPPPRPPSPYALPLLQARRSRTTWRSCTRCWPSCCPPSSPRATAPTRWRSRWRTRRGPVRPATWRRRRGWWSA